MLEVEEFTQDKIKDIQLKKNALDEAKMKLKEAEGAVLKAESDLFIATYGVENFVKYMMKFNQLRIDSLNCIKMDDLWKQND